LGDDASIFSTLSQDLLLFREIEKITLLRKIKGESRIFQYDENIDDYMGRTLKRIIKSEQKEFLFAKCVILVEGETEFGSLPIFAKNLGYNFDQDSISVIPVEGNYFVGFMKILQQYGIPFIALYDEDVLFKITHHIESNGTEIRTSTLINQLYELDLLDKSDLELIQKWEEDREKVINTRSYSYKLSSIIKSLKPHLSNPNIRDIYEKYKQYEKETFSEKYKQSIKNDIYNFINQKVEKEKYVFRFLSPDFEKFFQEKEFGKILVNAKQKYGNNKVLCGEYLAEHIKKEDIPEEISAIITTANNFIKNNLISPE
jgi:predicted ATP-dependent endonuclease of OLD family